MSTSLRQCFGSSSVDESLAQIDARTRELQPHEENISIGPFSVLKIAISAHESDSSPAQITNQPSTQIMPTQIDNAINVEQHTDNVAVPQAFDSAPSLVDWFDPILGFNDTLQWSDLFTLDFDAGNSLLMPQYAPNYPEHELGMLLPDDDVILSDGILREPIPLVANDHPSSASTQVPNDTIASNVVVETESCRISLTEVDSATEAQFLLKHFHDFVIPQWSFMPSNTKSPWIIFQLPDAVKSLSELTYLRTGTLKHANAANLYGILACSAYHLAVNSSGQTTKEPEYWMSLFTCLKTQANKHMQVSLREELRGTRKAKYKDQLMAILAMLSYAYGSVVDNMSAAYQAGRHHSDPEHAERLPPRSGHNARLDDFLRLEPHGSDSDLDIDEFKETEVSLRDIHLNDSRQYHGTMYNEIYGISETWLSLVSQTTRLANILDATKYAKDTDGHFLEFLQKRASRLENIVCSFALKDPPDDDGEEDGITTTARSVNHHMLQAMNSALVILFYRRIRNVNPLILQGHVGSVIQSLQDFDATLVSEGISGPGSAWPAFIAGCEALSRRYRDFIMAWLDKGFEKCGLETFGISRRLMKEVWKRQDERQQLPDPGSAGSNQSRASKLVSHQHTWVDVCREQEVWVTLY
ncbi:hypothetical protein N0V90_005917 [Kalmusia sp. IMI 367209]|nr:hypothetical protein N0V90_005917 [Kalmusia sp. IMI 367209]